MKRDKVIAYILAEDISIEPNMKIISDNNKCIKISADLQDTSELNRNKRRYPTSVVKNALKRENIQELIANGDWCGEAGHPIDPTIQRQTTILKSNISHRVLSYNFRGPIVQGIIKTYPSEMGRVMRDVILDDDPTRTAFSLRAIGPVKETSDGKIVQDPLTAFAYDWVSYPSHRKAYQKDIIKVTAMGNSLTESCCIPLLESQAIDYVKEESKHFKMISEMLEFDHKTATLTEDCKKIILTDNNGLSTDKLVIGVESYISYEAMEYMSKFR